MSLHTSRKSIRWKSLCIFILIYQTPYHYIFYIDIDEGLWCIPFKTHYSAQRTVAHNIRSESDASFSASSKIAFIKNSEVFIGASSSLEALTCFISFRAVTRHFWWWPALFLLRNPLPIPLVPDILTYGRFPSIRNPLTRSTASLFQLISEGFP